jgi:lipoate-protein ligase A
LVAAWRLLDLGELPPISTQAVYHAVGIAVDQGLARNTIIFCSPSSPLVCLGYHQELEIEVDVEYCRQKQLPIVRRILGGGAVYLDGDQLFYQIVASKSEPEVPATIQEIFRKFLEAPVKTYNDIGIPASYRPLNDIEVKGRKISGNGATEIGRSAVLTGNMIFDFNFHEMTRILKVPSEKFRDKVAKTLGERLTTIKKELGSVPSKDIVKDLLKKNYETSLNVNLVSDELGPRERKLVESLQEEYRSQEWLHSMENRHEGIIQKRHLKLSGRAHIGEVVHKTGGGLLRVLVETLDGRIADIMISGDFSLVPMDCLRTLESELRGVEASREALIDRVKSFYSNHTVESPGMNHGDLADAIIQASTQSPG